MVSGGVLLREIAPADTLLTEVPTAYAEAVHGPLVPVGDSSCRFSVKPAYAYD
jgi:hypothetical protein